MKTATIRQVRHEFSTILAWVAQGEEVTVLNRTRPVARILPPRPVAPAKAKMPDSRSSRSRRRTDTALKSAFEWLAEFVPDARPPTRWGTSQ